MARRRTTSGVESRVHQRLKDLVVEERAVEDKLDELRYDRSASATGERADLTRDLERLGIAIAESGSLLVEEFGWFVDDRGELRSPR